MARPSIPDINTLLQAGINPRTGLPVRFGDVRSATKENIKKILRVQDEQDAVNRYKWTNLPNDLTSQELERMIYYKGQLCFFYCKDLEQFYFMPYALDGTIDFYGRYNTIHPVPMTSGTEDKGDKAQAQYLASLKLKCRYGIVMPEDLTLKDFEESAVLLHDYTKQLAQTIIPRKDLNEGVIDVEAECIPYMRTALLMGTGVRGVRVQDEDQEASVHEGARNMTKAALNCEPYVPIVGTVEFQDLTDGTVTKAEDYLISMQAIENFRLSTYGMDSGGLYDKKAYVNQDQTQMNAVNVKSPMQDGLSIRQNFCNIVNSIWGLGIWCEPSETVVVADLNGDGVTYDRDEDGSQTGTEPSESEGENNG